MIAQRVWDLSEWQHSSDQLSAGIRASGSERHAAELAVRAARRVLLSYSSSFYLVTRLLPRAKRDLVQLIYAAVRYPDELVDTYAPEGVDVLPHLDRWQREYSAALESGGLRESVFAGLNPYVAAFAEVIKAHAIPPVYYYAFLAAMRSDLDPPGFTTLDDLLEEYVYGSATVVGYFLTYVYGTERADDFGKALECARELAIALQLTNFARDISDDFARGRLYVPREVLLACGWDSSLPREHLQENVLRAARRWLADYARQKYSVATRCVELFAADSRVAIESCIRVYTMLNDRLLEANTSLHSRPSVPWARKMAAVPVSKYWRILLAFQD